MNNSNNRKKYHQFASGWLKNSTKGQYISGVANGDKAKIKLFVELENGEKMAVNNFAVFFAETKENDRQPDARFVFTTEE